MIRRTVPFAREKQKQGLPPLGRVFFGWLAFVCTWGILLFPSETVAAPAGQISVQQSIPGNEGEDVLRLAWKAGQQLCLEGRFTKAVAYLRQYVKERPRSADGWYWLGKAQEGAGNLEKAQEAYRTALEVDPEYPALSRILAAHEDGNALPLWDPAQQPFSAQPTLPSGPAYYIAPQAHPVEVFVPQGGVVQGPAPQMLPMTPGTFPQQGGVVPVMPSPQGMVVPPGGGVPRIELSEPFQNLSGQQGQAEPLLPAPSPSPNKPSSTRPRVPLSSPVVVKPATPVPSGEQQASSPSKSAPVYVPPAPISQSGASTATGTPLPQENPELSPAQPSGEETPISQAPLYMPPKPSEAAPTFPLQDAPIPLAIPESPVFLPPTPATPQQPSLDRFSPSETTDSEDVPQALSGDVSQDNNTVSDSD